MGEADAAIAKQVRMLQRSPIAPLGAIASELDHRIELLFEKRLLNLARIVERAAGALPTGEVPDVEPDMAWTAAFSSGAQNISDEEMQQTWARVLAGEVERPGSTSIRTLSILRELNQEVALLFKRLCSLAVSLRVRDQWLDQRVISVDGDPGNNALAKYGLGYSNLLVLKEYGLITGEFRSFFDYRMCVATRDSSGVWNFTVPFCYQGLTWGLESEEGRTATDQLPIAGVDTTRAGKELSQVVENLDTVTDYDTALKDFFIQHGLRMSKLRPL